MAWLSMAGKLNALLHVLMLIKFKTKMQIEIIRTKSGGTPRYRNVFHAGSVIFREYGIRGVYQGLKATSVRDTPALWNLLW
jgi:hypothetical protein